jgi:hypothetical protein
MFSKKKKKQRKKKKAQIGTNAGAGVVKAVRLVRSQFASGRTYDRPTRSSISVIFLGAKAHSDLVLKFHVIVHGSCAALPMETLNILP